MEIKKIKMPIEVAKEEWRKYNELLKKRHDSYLKDMKKAMYQLSKGKELIDIYVVMENAGLNKSYQPRLAIARADWKECHFRKKDSGRGFYASGNRSWVEKSKGDIDLQPETFMNWPRIQDDIKMQSGQTRKVDRQWDIANSLLKSKVPLIPSSLTPDGDLSGYYILWEVDSWEEQVPKKDDPILLKRITENLFVILGGWDVTDLEQSIIRGL